MAPEPQIWPFPTPQHLARGRSAACLRELFVSFFFFFTLNKLPLVPLSPNSWDNWIVAITGQRIAEPPHLPYRQAPRIAQVHFFFQSQTLVNAPRGSQFTCILKTHLKFPRKKKMGELEKVSINSLPIHPKDRPAWDAAPCSC